MVNLHGDNFQGPPNCPQLSKEFQHVRSSNKTLASTGCTREFCQAGRAIHTDEPRVGENRALQVIEQEAAEYLQTLHREGFYDSEDAFRDRLAQVLQEIRSYAAEGVVQENDSHNRVGGNYVQTREELQFGVRRAWRNSRKCIMRSHCEELRLCDLREVTSSVDMGMELMKAVSEAFNGGNILPTVFVFPPRKVNSRGPLIWNNQILQFAGYRCGDGSIIGDPMSVELTAAIIELGWKPPQPRSRWDILPLVTMADGDDPALIELFPDLCKLVKIRHPQYSTEFGLLDLKWVRFPALTRLGFDIGGVQYTATPFIGWFMDAEIGVRNLADSFRYNVLPDIIRVLGLTQGKLVNGVETYEDLPEYEKLAMLSRAQAELNYAVHWSFLQEKVTMSDSLTASMKWSRFDDDFRRDHGYRLPADPYWLSPPQGSIIPLWHRGGAPNYQPKPMICRHAQNPIKAWRREQHQLHCATVLSESGLPPGGQKSIPVQSNTEQKFLPCEVIDVKSADHEMPLLEIKRTTPNFENLDLISIAIYFCSAGTIAEKLARKLHKWTTSVFEGSSDSPVCPRIEALNNLKESDLTQDKTLLLIVSSTGEGDVPTNGMGFFDLCHKLLQSPTMPRRTFSYSIFGNGDSRYSTYNGAAITIESLMNQLGGNSLSAGLFQSDTAIEPLPLRALESWWKTLQPSIHEPPSHPFGRILSPMSPKNRSTFKVRTSVMPVPKDAQRYEDHQMQLISKLSEATLIAKKPETHTGHVGSSLVSLKVCEQNFVELGCIQVLPSNSSSKVQRALRALCVEGAATVDFDFDGQNPTYLDFLTDFVDLELPFLGLAWIQRFQSASRDDLTKTQLERTPVLDVLERLHENVRCCSSYNNIFLQREICLDMPLLCTRTFSVASSLKHLLHHTQSTAGTGTEIDMIVKVHRGGRYSETFLNESVIPSSVKYRLVDSFSGIKLRSTYLQPFVIFATGAGFGPVRCLLQWRIATAYDTLQIGQSLPLYGRGFSIFLGLKECDLGLTVDVLNEAMALKLIDMVDIVVSNPSKRRFYDNITLASHHLKEKLMKQHGMVFVCGGKAAAAGAKRGLENVLDGSLDKILGKRYVEEVY